MDEYKSNSHKSKTSDATSTEHTKKVEKVVSGVAKVKKKSELRKFSDIFISEDAGNVKSYIFMDVLIPALKKAVSDIVTDGISMILYGSADRNKRSSSTSRVSYRNYYDRDDRRDEGPSRVRSGYNYDDIILPTRGEAEDVLSCMDDLIERYGNASVGDLYDLVGLQGNYTDMKYGWKNLSSASTSRTRDGYMLKLPRALPLD